MRIISAAIVAIGLAVPAAAENLYPVSDRSNFIAAVQGKDLTRFGIKLNVTPNGQIVGNAFGRKVSGAWQWRDGYFCRSLYWGNEDLGPNCQKVHVSGDTIRFTSDRGTGDHADLRLR